MRISLIGYLINILLAASLLFTNIFTIGAHTLKVDCLTPKMTILEMTKQMKIRFYQSNLMRKHLENLQVNCFTMKSFSKEKEKVFRRGAYSLEATEFVYKSSFNTDSIFFSAVICSCFPHFALTKT